MYVQVFTGRPHRPARLRQEWEALRLGAEASVAGLTLAGEWVAVLRHAGPVPPPDRALLSAVEGCLTRPRSAFATEDVQEVLAGAPAPGAEFIQVMQAKVTGRAGWAEADVDALRRFRAARPDFLGSLRAWHGDRLTVVDSYRTEAEARAGEAVVPSAEDEAAYRRWFSHLGDVSWHDLLERW